MGCIKSPWLGYNLLTPTLDHKGLSIQSLYLQILTLLGLLRAPLSYSCRVDAYILEADPLSGAIEECGGRILRLFVLELTDWLILFI